MTVTDEATDPADTVDSDEPADPSSVTTEQSRPPLYWRLLRLRNIHPNAWQRALLGEGAIAVAAILVLADRASAWLLVVLPLVVAGVVKAHDLLAGLLAPVGEAGETTTAPPEGSAVVEAVVEDEEAT